MRNELRLRMERLGPLSDASWIAFARHLRHRELPAGSHWLHAGERATQLGFLCGGLLRMYYLRPDGRCFNKGFLGAGSTVGAMDSFLLETPASFSIQALRDSTLLHLPWSKVQDLYESDPAWCRVGRRSAELLAVKKMQREASLLLTSPQERYLAFLEHHPDIAQHIADHHIASYIGITPEALSRIRKRIAAD